MSCKMQEMKEERIVPAFLCLTYFFLYVNFRLLDANIQIYKAMTKKSNIDYRLKRAKDGESFAE